MDATEAKKKIELIKAQPKKWLFGIDRAIDELVDAMFTLVPYTGHGRKELGQAHVLLRAVPGVGKTDLMRIVSFAVGATSQLVSGHPELMPFDILGGEAYIAPLGKFFLRRGPIFSHMFLFDEINRAHAKTQSVTLQAMEERIVILRKTDVARETYQTIEFPLLPISDDPNETRLFFWFIATANPIEQEGTYQLPEAQLDRFTHSFRIGYPSRENEMRIRARNVIPRGNDTRVAIEKIIDLPEVLDISHLIYDTMEYTEEESKRADDYIQRIIESSRPKQENETGVRNFTKPELRSFVDEYVQQGISPRSNYHFNAAARTYAFLYGNGKYVTVDDVKKIAMSVMNHRLLLNGSARGAKITAEDVVREILDKTEAP